MGRSVVSSDRWVQVVRTSHAEEARAGKRSDRESPRPTVLACVVLDPILVASTLGSFGGIDRSSHGAAPRCVSSFACTPGAIASPYWWGGEIRSTPRGMRIAVRGTPHRAVVALRCGCIAVRCRSEHRWLDRRFPRVRRSIRPWMESGSGSAIRAHFGGKRVRESRKVCAMCLALLPRDRRRWSYRGWRWWRSASRCFT